MPIFRVRFVDAMVKSEELIGAKGAVTPYGFRRFPG